MRKHPYFDIVSIPSGGASKPHKDIYTKDTDKLKISPQETLYADDDVKLLARVNKALEELNEENMNLTYRLATIDVEHSGKVANYFVLGMSTGIALWEIIKLIVG